ncbi:ras guanine nucleotide exchange factor K-like [Gigantopelta aegis]|uniref:ras guanine nucleotide exchange factor K-like n=1 Tax=Gigantopelta aegis TaxID=1735272 RepID=UPI001B887B9E|nr:ras guanine nucleotide exchange factor K-like [Gigantopelta aegis]
MDNYHLPMKIEANDDEEYIVEHNDNGDYDDDDLISPTGHSESDWASLQDSAAGKLRLKRRRKCGQCGPCQVKENCDKCHFCLRRDVLKQSCIYRKCLYLRKKPSRVRDCVPPSSSSRHPSSSQSPSAASSSACVSTPVQNSTSPLSPISVDGSHCRPPQPSPSYIPGNSSATNSHQHLTPDPHRPLLGVDPLPAGFQPDPLRQLPVPPPPDPLRSSYQSPPQADVLRSHSADQARSPHADMRPMSSDTVRSLPTSQAPPTPVSVDQLRPMPTDPLHHMQSESLRQFQNNHLRPFQADQLRPPLGMESLRPFPSEQYGMAYGPPRHVWPPPGLPSPYNFQTNNMNMGASPSCRMSLPDACRYSMPAQPSFPHHPHHHHMPFNINSDFRPPVPFGTPSSLGPPMNPPFYPPPPVPPVPSTSLPTLPIVQYSASQETYPGSRFAAPPMYTGSLYSPFRPPSEPYIYHAQFPPMESVFSGNGSKMAYFRDQFLRHCDKSDLSKDFHSNTFADDDKAMMLEKYRCIIEDSVMSSSSLKLSEKMDTKEFYSSCKDIDDDLREEMSRITRDGECNVCISIDDYKMQAFIRSDGVNNLEIEIESPVELSPNNTCSNKNKHPENHNNNNNNNNSTNNNNNNNKTNNNNSNIADTESPKPREVIAPVARRTTVVGTVCIRQDLGDEGIMQLEVPGHRVFLEETILDDTIISQSDKPAELIHFIQTPAKTCSDSLDDLVL